MNNIIVNNNIYTPLEQSVSYTHNHTYVLEPGYYMSSTSKLVSNNTNYIATINNTLVITDVKKNTQMQSIEHTENCKYIIATPDGNIQIVDNNNNITQLNPTINNLNKDVILLLNDEGILTITRTDNLNNIIQLWDSKAVCLMCISKIGSAYYNELCNCTLYPNAIGGQMHKNPHSAYKQFLKLF